MVSIGMYVEGPGGPSLTPTCRHTQQGNREHRHVVLDQRLRARDKPGLVELQGDEYTAIPARVSSQLFTCSFVSLAVNL